MKVRYRFYLLVLIWLHFPCLSRAVTLMSKPALPGVVGSAPRMLYPVQNGGNVPLSDKVDEAGLLLRKTMRIEAMIQRSWITSMVVPGLGQVYNKDYWKVPLLYLGFALVGSRIYSEHQEMNNYKRTLLMNDDKLNHAFADKRIKECERTRNLFIIIASAWYLLNIFDAYAGGHDKTVNFKDDIDTNSTSKPTAVLKPIAAVRPRG